MYMSSLRYINIDGKRRIVSSLGHIFQRHQKNSRHDIYPWGYLRGRFRHHDGLDFLLLYHVQVQCPSLASERRAADMDSETEENHIETSPLSFTAHCK